MASTKPTSAATDNKSKDAADTAKAAHQPGDKLDPNLLEEDDEFEEFPTEDWKSAEGDVDGTAGSNALWEDNWDDDAQEDDFSKMLRAELEKKSTTA